MACWRLTGPSAASSSLITLSWKLQPSPIASTRVPGMACSIMACTSVACIVGLPRLGFRLQHGSQFAYMSHLLHVCRQMLHGKCFAGLAGVAHDGQHQCQPRAVGAGYARAVNLQVRADGLSHQLRSLRAQCRHAGMIQHASQQKTLFVQLDTHLAAPGWRTRDTLSTQPSMTASRLLRLRCMDSANWSRNSLPRVMPSIITLRNFHSLPIFTMV